MTFAKQLIAFGGMIFLGGAMLPTGEAFAFGQQWRPAPGYGMPQVGSHGRIANSPSFRPHSAARPAMNRSLNRPRRPHQQRSYRPLPYQQQFFAAQRYPMYPGAGPAGGGFYPQQPRAMAAGYPAPGWSSPFANMAQPWGFQMPMFTRQFAWRPAEQPWVARNPMPQQAQPRYRQAQPQYRVTTMPQAVGFRQVRSGAAPAVGSWRPAVQPSPAVRPQYAYQRYATRPPVTPAVRQSMFRTAPRSGYPMPGARIAGLGRAPVQAPPGNWRPQAAAPADGWRSSRSFRPQGYGRSVADKAEVASGREGSGFTRDNLPGWVTTYQDSGYEGACSWCSGS